MPRIKDVTDIGALQSGDMFPIDRSLSSSANKTTLEAISLFIKRLSVVSVSISQTLDTDYDTVLCSGTIIVTLPVPADSVGKVYSIKNVSTGVITIAGQIDGATNFDLKSQGESVTVVCDGTEWWII
jgi:hypothetical protein